MGGTVDDVMSLPTNSFVSINIYICMQRTFRINRDVLKLLFFFLSFPLHETLYFTESVLVL